MKTRGTFLILGAILILFNGGCGKEEDAIKDCEKNNYGVITVKFASVNEEHSIVITTPPGLVPREKLVAKGITSDTLHLKPGFHVLSISSLNANGLAIEQESKNVAIITCSQETISVSF